MFKRLGSLFKVYEDEVTIFWWTLALLFFIRSSCIVLNNFSETAFLKRYGVEYLPIVYVVNSILTFVIMGSLVGVMKRLPGTRLLTYLLLFCGFSIGLLRLAIPLDIDLIYPFLYVLNTQYEALLILVFWNLGNDLFNTRQSKRLFPLITIAGVIGRIIGSFGTPMLVEAVSFDNLMLVYLGLTIVSAGIAARMVRLFPTLLILSRENGKTSKTKASSLKQDYQQMWHVIQSSLLMKIVIFLTLLPNIIIPILNYQFNFAVNETFASEGSLIKFFGYFRGSMNIVSLIILLFVGRVYRRWGLPIVLMVHPFNYFFVFTAFLLRFDLLSAMYARLSTNIIRTTLNAPVMAILMGLFPEGHRHLVRPFLRGTVVRIGLLIGSGVILINQSYFSPKILSIFAMICSAGWIFTTIVLKRNYASILVDLISRNILDLRSMEEKDVDQIFKDKSAQARMNDHFQSAKGETAVWYASQLKKQEYQGLDNSIFAVLDRHHPRLQVRLMGYLSPSAGRRAVAVAWNLVNYQDHEMMKELMAVINQFPSQVTRSFNESVYETCQIPIIKAYAVMGLYSWTPRKYDDVIKTWLVSEDESKKIAGVVAAAGTGDKGYISIFKEMIEARSSDEILPYLLNGLDRLGAEADTTVIIPLLSHPDLQIRLAALKHFEVRTKSDMNQVIMMLADPNAQICELAHEKLLNAPFQDPFVLINALNLPKRKIREGIFVLLESLNIKDLDMIRYAYAEVEKAYRCLWEKKLILSLPDCPEKQLLHDHLSETKDLRMKNLLRVLSTQDPTGKMRVLLQGIFSKDSRQVSNSLEVLEELVDDSLARRMTPLFENFTLEETLEIGKHFYQFPDPDVGPSGIIVYFLNKEDWVTVVLTLGLVIKNTVEGLEKELIQKLSLSSNPHIRLLAGKLAL